MLTNAETNRTISKNNSTHIQDLFESNFSIAKRSELSNLSRKGISSFKNFELKRFNKNGKLLRKGIDSFLFLGLAAMFSKTPDNFRSKTEITFDNIERGLQITQLNMKNPYILSYIQ
jgi:hypothetical protein